MSLPGAVENFLSHTLSPLVVQIRDCLIAYQKNRSGRRDSLHAASGICLSGYACFICENHVL